MTKYKMKYEMKQRQSHAILKKIDKCFGVCIDCKQSLFFPSVRCECSGIPIFRISKEKENWFEKLGSSRNRGLKLVFD